MRANRRTPRATRHNLRPSVAGCTRPKCEPGFWSWSNPASTTARSPAAPASRGPRCAIGAGRPMCGVSPPWPRSTCPQCWRSAKPMWFTPEDYGELLGLYLGDGCISSGPRTYRLRITLDARYPRITGQTRDLVQRCLPANRVDIDKKGTKGSCVNVSSYSLHWPCLLPQHGRGKKHERPIALEPWQREIVEAAPWPFIRGCIRTDGCAFINRTGPYEYLSYEFSNMSTDIVDLFVETCAAVDVFTRVTRDPRGVWHVRSIGARALLSCSSTWVSRSEPLDLGTARGCGGTADSRSSGGRVRKDVWVRIPPAASLRPPETRCAAR